MGAGASALAPAVKTVLIEEFSKKRSEFDAKITSNTGDEDIAKFLTDFGASMVKLALVSAQTPPSGKIVHKPVQGGLAKGSSSKAGKSRRGPTRRRSYGVSDAKKLEAVAEQKPMTESASAPVIDAVDVIKASQDEMAKQMAAMKLDAPSGTVEETVDSWDSVTQLPYCNVCQMAFKNAGQLSRHEKYSNLHTMNVKAANTDADKEKAESEKQLAIRQEEGKDYRLLYYGSKFFWRTQDNIDLSFYQHIVLHVIEVVPFDVYKNKQMDRLYFDKFIVESLIDADVRKTVEEKRKADYELKKSNKFGDGATFNFDEEYATAQRMELTTFMLARLQLHHVSQEGQGNKPKSKIVFVPSNGSEGTIAENPLLETPPPLLIPVSVTHRRNTSNAEVKKKLDEVHKSQEELKSAIGKAEKITQHVHNFLSIKNSLQKYKDMSLPKKRFVMAANKIIMINMVEKTKKHLANLEAAKNPEKIVAGRSRRESIKVRKEV